MSRKPLSLQVRDQLLDAIRSGGFEDGRLPPEAGKPVIAIHDVVPLVAGGGEPRGLGIPEGRAYVELRETLFSADHERVAFSTAAVDDTLVRLSLVRREG